MILETERLILRTVRLHDAGDIYEFSKNPNVGPNAGWKPHKSKRDSLKVMHSLFLDNMDIFGIVPREVGKLIGTIGLAEDTRRRVEGVKMLGYAIGEPYWGRGYVTEAAMEVLKYGFEERGLCVVSAYCYPGNARSRRVLEKCGLTYEGRMRSAERLVNGDITDDLCFSITKQEYVLQHGG